jgi:hypothetical protein
MVIDLSPGLKSMEGAKELYANQNIAHLLEDANLKGVAYRRDPSSDDGDGRFAYHLSCGEKEIKIDMPGLPLEQVRYVDGEDQNVLDFPRLYVDGSSWFWKFAVDSVRESYEKLDKPSEDSEN